MGRSIDKQPANRLGPGSQACREPCRAAWWRAFGRQSLAGCWPHSAGAETLANAVKGDPDVVEKDRLRSSPYLLYNWSLRRGDPFLHRLFLAAGVPHLAKASCQELQIRFQPPRARLPRIRTKTVQLDPTLNPSCSIYNERHHPQAARYSKHVSAHLHRRLLEECLSFPCSTQLTTSTRRILTLTTTRFYGKSNKMAQAGGSYNNPLKKFK